MRKYIYILLCIFSIACGKYDTKIEAALRLAGNNREELEKVLHHYSQNTSDSLKLKAAKFLIENMPGHYTMEGNLVNYYREQISEHTKNSYFAKKIYNISLCQIEQLQHSCDKKEDIHHIKADFLINHINKSFENLNKYSWLSDIPFDLFLEYILPYRFANEPLDRWIDSLHISLVALQEIILKDCRNDLTQLEYNLHFSESTNFLFSNSIQKLFKQNIYNDCRHTTLKENFYARNLCLPCAIDFIPHYANRNGYHYWNKIISPEYKSSDVRGALERKTAKVYRKTFSRHSTIISTNSEYIPEFFLDPFIQDVSNEYLNTTDITICTHSDISPNSHHAYLCVFNDLDWKPIAIGDILHSTVKFRNMGKNLVYLPAYYRKKKLFPLNYPFILNLKGEIKHLIPDTNNLQKLTLTRKYPSNTNLYNYNIDLKELVIEASNQASFHHSDTFCLVFQKTYYEGNINLTTKYRYWKISLPHFHPCPIMLAELAFYDKQGTLLQGHCDSTFLAAFDKNPLTNITIKPHNPVTNNKINDNKPLIVDFHKPVEISRITCLPRSDGNGIYPRNEYELFYYDSNGWRSLGRTMSEDYYLEYNNVPSGALYWLHNWTTGSEERIFTQEKKIIRFW